MRVLQAWDVGRNIPHGAARWAKSSSSRGSTAHQRRSWEYYRTSFLHYFIERPVVEAGGWYYSGSGRRPATWRRSSRSWTAAETWRAAIQALGAVFLLRRDLRPRSRALLRRAETVGACA
jgi:hypothetical protein